MRILLGVVHQPRITGEIMNNIKIMDAKETLDYFALKVKNNERIVFARYGDGEFFLMNKKSKAATENFATGDLLNSSISRKGQFICTPVPYDIKDYEELKIIKKKTRWLQAQVYFIEKGQHEIYGSTGFIVDDFRNGTFCVLPYFFNGRVLVVTRYAKEVLLQFKNKVQVYEVPGFRASSVYKPLKEYLLKKSNSFDNIVFACGPIGKVLIADMADKCSSNLADFGSMINAILYNIDKSIIENWSMSWAVYVDMKEKCNLFQKSLNLEI